MPATIQVVLQDDVQNLGKSGELVKVRPGYARNFLLPRQMAVPATTAHINRIAHEKIVALAKADKAKKEAQEVAAKLSSTTIKLTRKVGEDDRLFGSVTAKEIHAAAEAQGLKFDRKKMHLAEPLKALGTFEIPVKLATDVTATLKVEVARK